MCAGPTLLAVPGQQDCSSRVKSGSPAKSAVHAMSEASDWPAVSAGSVNCAHSASCARLTTSAEPFTLGITSAGATDSVDFSDTWIIHISLLLEDLDRSVVEPLCVGVDGATG